MRAALGAPVQSSIEPAIRRSLMVAVLTWIPTQAAFKPITDTDIWWHLSAGRWMVEHGGLPTTDPFTRVGAAGKLWHAYSWLYELMMFGLYSTLGPAALVVYTATLTVAIAAGTLWLVRRHTRGSLLPFALTGAAMVSLLPIIDDRPWMLTIALFTSLLLVLTHGRNHPRALWLAVPLFWLWANLHIVFVYGLGVMGFAWLDGVAGRLGWGDRERHFDPGTMTWVLLACVVATLLTPHHVKLWLIILELIDQTTPFDLIIEVQAPKFREIPNFVFLFMSIGAAGALGWRQRRDVFSLLLLLAGVYLSHRAGRDVWFVAIGSALILGDTLKGSAFDPPDKSSEAFRAWHAPLVAVWMLIGLGAAGKLAWVSNTHLEASIAETFPVAAVDHVVQTRPGGPLYNTFGWGGYLIWRLKGLDLPVSIDGRTNVHGEKRLQYSMNSWHGFHGDWRTDPDLASANLVVGPSDLPLIHLLESSGAFRKTFGDDQATVMVRIAPHPR